MIASFHPCVRQSAFGIWPGAIGQKLRKEVSRLIMIPYQYDRWLLLLELLFQIFQSLYQSGARWSELDDTWSLWPIIRELLIYALLITSRINMYEYVYGVITMGNEACKQRKSTWLKENREGKRKKEKTFKERSNNNDCSHYYNGGWMAKRGHGENK